MMTQLCYVDTEQSKEYHLETALNHMDYQDVAMYNYACSVDSVPLYDDNTAQTNKYKNVQTFKCEPLKLNVGGIYQHTDDKLVAYGLRHNDANALTVMGIHIAAPTRGNPFRYQILPGTNDMYEVWHKGEMQRCSLTALYGHVLSNAYIYRGKLYGDATQYCMWTSRDGQYTDYQEGNMLDIWNGKTVNIPELHVVYTAEMQAAGIGYSGSPVIFVDAKVSEVPAGLFNCNSTLVVIAFKGVVHCIHKEAFAGCVGLNMVYAPHGVGEIKREAFRTARALYRLNLKLLSMGRIEAKAFENAGINVLELHASKESGEGTELEGHWQHNLPYLCTLRAYGKFLSTKPGVAELLMWSFTDCHTLHSVVLPESAQKLSRQAFLRCENLRTVQVEGGIRHVGFGTFCGCCSLQQIDLSKCTVIETGGFGMALAPGIVIALHDCKLYSEAFSSSGIASVKLQNCTLVGGAIFKDCKQLSTAQLQLSWPGSMQQYIPAHTFNGCVALQQVIITSEKPLGLFKQAFYRCNKLQSIVSNRPLLFDDPSALEGIPQQLRARMELMGRVKHYDNTDI